MYDFKGVKNTVKLNQIFCRHSWQTIDSYRFSQWMNNTKNECLSDVQECSKCGKKRAKFIVISHEAPLLRSY